MQAVIVIASMAPEQSLHQLEKWLFLMELEKTKSTIIALSILIISSVFAK